MYPRILSQKNTHTLLMYRSCPCNLNFPLRYNLECVPLLSKAVINTITHIIRHTPISIEHHKHNSSTPHFT